MIRYHTQSRLLYRARGYQRIKYRTYHEVRELNAAEQICRVSDNDRLPGQVNTLRMRTIFS